MEGGEERERMVSELLASLSGKRKRVWARERGGHNSLRARNTHKSSRSS